MKFLDGGLLILSKQPIIEQDSAENHSPKTIRNPSLNLSRLPLQDSIVFTAGSQIDAWAAKGVIYAKIQVGSNEDRYIHVFNTHLQADQNEPGLEH